MPCVGCTEFLVQGSGTVGEGTNFSYEKVVIAEDPDNIPLVLLSVKALDKDDVLLVDQTPAWLEATTSGQSVLVGARLVYRLTVTGEIDAFRILEPGSGDPTEWGEGTYTIELRAQVEDGSKPVIVCLFDVCITGAVPTAALFFIHDQNNQIWTFDVVRVRETIAVIITTEGTGATTGRIAWDAVNERVLWCDARGADVAVFVYSADFDGTVIVKLGGAISASTTTDEFTNCQVSINGRIGFNSVNKKGIMDADGLNQTFYSESNFNRRDLAPTDDANEFYSIDGSADLRRIFHDTGADVEILDGVTAVAVVTDRANIDEEFLYWRTGKTIRRVARDGSGDTEIYDGSDIDNMQILIGIEDDRFYFVYDAAGETHIGSVNKAGGDFTDHDRIDDVSQTNWAANAGTIRPETPGS